jgi:ABC-type spermidine/putrescine transport system permease subunit I
MTMDQLGIAYGTVAFFLLLPFIILLVRRKAEVKKVFTLPSWSSCRLSYKEALSGELWLKLFLATFIALCTGVIVALTALSYGIAWALALSLIFVTILFLLPKLLG